VRIAYLSNSWLKDEPANAVHVMQMCAHMSTQGHEVALFAHGTRTEANGERVFMRYGIEQRFALKLIDLPRIKSVGVLVYGIIQSFRAVVLWKPDLAYARCLISAIGALTLGQKVVVEFHEVPDLRRLRWVYARILRHKRLLRAVAISQGLVDDLKLSFPESAENVDWVVAHDAANPVESSGSFCLAIRGELNVGYAGGLREGNGIALILELARLLPSYAFHMVGGGEAEIRSWGQPHPLANVHWYGRLAPAEVSKFLASCDVLLAPYIEGPKTSGGSDTSRWMSPLKIFEYMASGKPIVVSDIPVLREVLSDEWVRLEIPGCAEAWVSALKALECEALRRKLGDSARNEFLSKHTWSRRVAKVLQGLEGVEHGGRREYCE
jgi:glycosyltransferase involved in cell wall biosynthesis